MKAMFIVSSKQLRNFIHELNPDDYHKHDYVIIKGEGGKVFFEDLPDRKLDVEIKNAPFEMTVQAKQLRKFYQILGIIYDQPITITVDGNRYINFHAVV